jgi:hypothetical protein
VNAGSFEQVPGAMPSAYRVFTIPGFIDGDSLLSIVMAG